MNRRAFFFLLSGCCVAVFCANVATADEPVLLTREWKLPPTGMPVVKLSPLPAEIELKLAEREKNSKDWLISGGTAVPGTRSANYIQKTNRLIVRDTEVHIQEIDAAIEKAWREYRASEAKNTK